MVRPEDRNQSQNIKIDIRACSDSELYDAFCDLSYAFFLLECPESPARKAYGIECGRLQRFTVECADLLEEIYPDFK